jgi:hypothetical protein
MKLFKTRLQMATAMQNVRRNSSLTSGRLSARRLPGVGLLCRRGTEWRVAVINTAERGHFLREENSRCCSSLPPPPPVVLIFIATAQSLKRLAVG